MRHVAPLQLTDKLPLWSWSPTNLADLEQSASQAGTQDCCGSCHSLADAGKTQQASLLLLDSGNEQICTAARDQQQSRQLCKAMTGGP